MARWSRRQELRELLRDHPWIWKAPFVAATLLVWGTAIVLFLGPWQGESGSPDTIRTLPPPATATPDESVAERGPVRPSSTASRLAGDVEAGAASETTEVGSAPSTGDVAEVPPGSDLPAPAETVDDSADQTTGRSSSPTPAPPTATTTAPAPPIATPTTRPPTVTVATPTTRPPTVTIPRPTVPATTAPPTTQPPTVPATSLAPALSVP
jgi:hypothetical protein